MKLKRVFNGTVAAAILSVVAGAPAVAADVTPAKDYPDRPIRMLLHRDPRNADGC